ncbi:MAG: hypothetical protein ETSY1_38765 [Candidatus Entotheonella factor]|uniref:Guanylate cyclase domain-containing protein n=1 Tax=Entotheonella factor TaxID=1429438 RepID=W4L651_ENTF1|nr:MAG: hypothetical protein ETSY1_38765 [Candidatus Entotheonella factor]
MDFYDRLAQVTELLRSEGRASYRALKRQFDLDDDYLEDLKDALLYAHPMIDDGRGLIWADAADSAPESTSLPTARRELSTEAPGIAAETRTPDAERRQLTVMFCDLVDSTHLSGQLDPEDFHEVVRAYQQTVADVIRRFDGYIARYMGDGLLVYFGYPQAHEDNATRAVRTGLEIVSAMPDINARLSCHVAVIQAHPLRVRIGVHTGLVVIEEIGEGLSREHQALGETPNIAARIQGLAAPNTIVISEATCRLARGYFDCEALGERVLRGVAEPIAVYCVLQARGAHNPLDIASAHGLTPLIGREAEMVLLLERWQQAKSGQGQIVLLSGEAGIGKSRLGLVLKNQIADELCLLLECKSLPYYQNTALYPITDLLQRILNWKLDDTPEVKLDKLEKILRQYGFSLDETVSLFATLLSLPVPEDRYPPLNLPPLRQRQKTLESIVAIILELAQRKPLLFILTQVASY